MGHDADKEIQSMAARDEIISLVKHKRFSELVEKSTAAVFCVPADPAAAGWGDYTEEREGRSCREVGPLPLLAIVMGEGLPDRNGARPDDGRATWVEIAAAAATLMDAGRRMIHQLLKMNPTDNEFRAEVLGAFNHYMRDLASLSMLDPTGESMTTEFGYEEMRRPSAPPSDSRTQA